MLASLVTWHPSPHLALCPPNRKSPLRGIHILNKKTGKVDKVGRLALPWSSSLRWRSCLTCRSLPVRPCQQLPVRGLFYAIGHEPNTGIFKV